MKSTKLAQFVHKKKIFQNWQLYLLLVPVFAYYIIFHYAPMYGVQIAFKDYIINKGIFGSPWIGLKYFRRYFNSAYFFSLIYNTVAISLWELILGFPIPILLALMVNEVRNVRFKKVIQNITYAPHFLSTVVIVGILFNFLNTRTGMINMMIKALGGTPVRFLYIPSMFRPIYTISGIWQNMGWNSIIYIAALAGIDPELHEAAKIDGASRLKRIIHINIPGIMPTMVILLILNIGGIMSVGFEKVYLMQNDANITTADVISTYSYRTGIQGGNFSYASAIGFVNSVINMTLLVTFNQLSKKIGGSSLF